MNRAVCAAAAWIGAMSLLVGSSAAQSPEKFNFALNWFAVGDHAAYWVALDKGYFHPAGARRDARELEGIG
jgi:NitT/TauT family transport system substrate-binding protein